MQRCAGWGRSGLALDLDASSHLGLVNPTELQPLLLAPLHTSFDCLLLRVQALLGKLDTLLVLQHASPGVPGDHSAAEAAAGIPGTPSGQHAAAVRAAEPPAGSPASVSAQPASVEEVEEQVEVSLQQGEDGQLSFKLSLSPSKPAVAAATPEPTHEADPGHMPASPAASSAGRPTAVRRSESVAPRPGALHEGAARGEQHTSRPVLVPAKVPPLAPSCQQPQQGGRFLLYARLPSALNCLPASHLRHPAAAELLCFLRDAVDTRKAPVMEVALDCIQKLISFKLLQGPVHHINHRRARCAAAAAVLVLLLLLQTLLRHVDERHRSQLVACALS